MGGQSGTTPSPSCQGWIYMCGVDTIEMRAYYVVNIQSLHLLVLPSGQEKENKSLPSSDPKLQLWPFPNLTSQLDEPGLLMGK